MLEFQQTLDFMIRFQKQEKATQEALLKLWRVEFRKFFDGSLVNVARALGLPPFLVDALASSLKTNSVEQQYDPNKMQTSVDFKINIVHILALAYLATQLLQKSGYEGSYKALFDNITMALDMPINDYTQFMLRLIATTAGASIISALSKKVIFETVADNENLAEV